MTRLKFISYIISIIGGAIIGTLGWYLQVPLLLIVIVSFILGFLVPPVLAAIFYDFDE